MFIVTDERALWVGGQGRLAGPGETKEQRHVTGRAHVGRAVHGQVAGLRQQEVQHAKDRLLDLARILRAADQDGALGEVHHNKGLGVGAVEGRVSFHRRQVDDGPIGLNVCAVFWRRAQEHVLGKEVVPRVLGHNADLDLQLVVSAGGEVLNKEPLVLGAVEHQRFKTVVTFRVERLVHRAPVDLVFGQGIADGVFVLGRAPGELTGTRHERAIGAELAFAFTHGPFHEFGAPQVPIDFARLGSDGQLIGC